MNKRLLKHEPVNVGTTRLVLAGRGGRVSLTGPALAVIALIAVLGLIVLGGKLIDLTEKAIASPTTQPIRSELGPPR